MAGTDSGVGVWFNFWPPVIKLRRMSFFEFKDGPFEYRIKNRTAKQVNENGGLIDCSKCGKTVYKYMGVAVDGERIMAKDFISVDEKIANPEDGQRCLCPYCQTDLFALRTWT